MMNFDKPKLQLSQIDENMFRKTKIGLDEPRGTEAKDLLNVINYNENSQVTNSVSDEENEREEREEQE